MFQVREIKPEDLKEVTEIYNYYVISSASTFDNEKQKNETLKHRFDTLINQKMPILIAESNKKVIGYAYTSPYRQRWGYRFTVEDSIFIHKDFVRKGIGEILLKELIKKVKILGFNQIVAIIGDSSNFASIKLHRKLGFQIIGKMPKIGRKFNKWLDNVIMQKTLNE